MKRLSTAFAYGNRPTLPLVLTNSMQMGTRMVINEVSHEIPFLMHELTKGKRDKNNNSQWRGKIRSLNANDSAFPTLNKLQRRGYKKAIH